MSDEIILRIEGLDPRQNAILNALRHGATRTAAAQAAGVHRDTFYTWFRQNPTFSDAVREAEAHAEIDYSDVIHQSARGGQLRKRTITRKPDGTIVAVEEWTVADWRPAAWWLDRRKRDWQGPKPLDLSTLTDEQLTRLFEKEAGSTGEEETPASGPEA